MIRHPDTQCWASKLTMLFSFEWRASMFVAAAVLLAPMFAQQCNVIHTLQQDNGHISILLFH
jgi:hypothetical protein